MRQVTAMNDNTIFPVRIYYDGACPVCRAEIEHYLRMDREGKLQAMDISDPDFHPGSTGFSQDELMSSLHVIDATGRVSTGIDAFQTIWHAFPHSTVLGLISAIIGLPLINPLARLGYRCFARLRRYLPKSHHRCSDDSCHR